MKTILYVCCSEDCRSDTMERMLKYENSVLGENVVTLHAKKIFYVIVNETPERWLQSEEFDRIEHCLVAWNIQEPEYQEKINVRLRNATQEREFQENDRSEY